jgi:hypothetical protein
MCQQTRLGDPYMDRVRASTHLEVLLRSLLPLLGHGAGPDGAGEHAGEGENSEGTEDDGNRDEENLAALIRRRGTAGAVGTEGDEVGYCKKSSLACGYYRRCCMRGGGCAGCTDATGQLGCALISPGYVIRLAVELNGSVGGFYAPAFFSCMVNSFQSVFMRSLSDIQRSACSWGGC